MLRLHKRLFYCIYKAHNEVLIHNPGLSRFINQAVVALKAHLVGGRIWREELGFSAFATAYSPDFYPPISGGIDRAARAACASSGKIRHYGFLSTRVKQNCLSQIRFSLNMKEQEIKPKLTVKEVLRITKGIDPDLCPECGQGTLICIQELPRLRGSPNYRKCS